MFFAFLQCMFLAAVAFGVGYGISDPLRRTGKPASWLIPLAVVVWVAVFGAQLLGRPTLGEGLGGFLIPMALGVWLTRYRINRA